MKPKCSSASSCSSSSGSLLKCDVSGCRETFKYRMEKSRHMKKCHSGLQKKTLPFTITEDEKFRCNRCKKVFQHRNSVYKHINNNCSDQELNQTFQCPECDRHFQYASRLSQHLKKHTNEESSYSCQKCGKVYQRSDHHLKHEQKCDADRIINPSLDPDPWLIQIENEAAAQPSQNASNDNSNVDGDWEIEAMYQYIEGDECRALVDQEVPGISFLDDKESESVNPFNSTELEVPSLSMLELESFHEESASLALPTTNVSIEVEVPSIMIDDTNDVEPIVDDNNNEIDFTQLSGSNTKKTKKTMFLESLYTRVKDKGQGTSRTIEVVEESVEEVVCRGFMRYLKELKNEKCWKELAKLMVTRFSNELRNPSFLSRVAKELNMRPARFIHRISVWWNNDFVEVRGKKKLSISVRQLIVDMCLENSIPSVDCRNGRQVINISKKKFEKDFAGIEFNVTLESKVNERRVQQISAVRRITTCSLRKLQSKIFDKYNIRLGLGSIYAHQPFFMRLATDKEKELCLHKFCLNLRLQFNALMEHSRKYDGPDFISMTSFFTDKIACEKDEKINYWPMKCCLGKCKNCKSWKMPTIPKEDETISYYQFEVVKEKRMSKKTKKMKEFKRTDRVSHVATVGALCSQFVSMKDKYLYHRYQIENDKVKWKSVLSTVDRGNIFWMDYSENLTGTPKWEPQDSHFAKKQYSLHCTVQYNTEGTEYFYHLSNDRTHDSIFTSAVANDLVSRHRIDDWEVIRFKSDNCSTQYKCRHVFPKWICLASSTNKIVLVYFGVNGHGKGLVDSMSGFGVKQPIRFAIIQKDFFFESADDIYNYLVTEMVHKPERHYHLLEEKDLQQNRNEDKIEFKIKDCMRRRMFAFFPDGLIQAKDNMCDCSRCLQGDFVHCPSEKGVVVVEGEGDDSDDSDDDFAVDEEENEEDGEEDWFPDDSDTLLSEVQDNSYVAIFSAANANEPFYLIHVKERKVANEVVRDDNHHEFGIGQSYIAAQYLEKVAENQKKGFVQYKVLSPIVFVRPSQVFYPCVKINDELKLTYEEFNFLSDCTFIAR